MASPKLSKEQRAKQKQREESRERAALEIFRRLRWRSKVACPYCNRERTGPHRAPGRMPRLQCLDCHRSFTPLVKTIFAGSRAPMASWMRAIAAYWKAPPSIMDIARAADVKHETARRMHEILLAGFTAKDELLLRLAAHIRRYPPKEMT